MSKQVNKSSKRVAYNRKISIEKLALSHIELNSLCRYAGKFGILGKTKNPYIWKYGELKIVLNKYFEGGQSIHPVSPRYRALNAIAGLINEIEASNTK